MNYAIACALALLLMYSPLLLGQAVCSTSSAIESGADFYVGYHVAMSNDRLAVVEMDENAVDHLLQVYEWDGSTWAPMGAGIALPSCSSFLTDWISLEGDRLALAIPLLNGEQEVLVYEWDGQQWARLGAAINDGIQSRSDKEVYLSGNRLAVGTPTRDLPYRNEGLVHVYEWTNGTWTLMGDPFVGEQANAYLGSALDLEGDWLVMSSGRASDTDQGKVVSYYWDGSQWVLRRTLVLESNAGTRARELDLDGDRLALITRNDDFGGRTRAWVYYWADGEWEEEAQLPSGEFNYRAGNFKYREIILEGDHLLLSAPDELNGDQEGFVYAHYWNGQDWHSTVKTFEEPSGTHRYFGVAIAMNAQGFVASSTDFLSNRRPNGNYFGSVYTYSFCDPDSPLTNMAYPNPTTGFVYWQLEAVQAEMELQVYNVNGQLVANRTYQRTDRISYDFKDCESGIYVVKIRLNGGAPTIHKVIKQ